MSDGGDADGVWFVVPGPLSTPTGGFAYDRRMAGALAAAGRLAGVIVLAGAFPAPSPAAVAAAAARLTALPDGATLIVDGLALAPLADVFAAHAGRLRLIALVHHPLADETGLTAAAQARWTAAERRALAAATAIVTTSATTAARLRSTFVAGATPIAQVPPGAIDRPPPSARGNAGGPPRLLAVGSLTARKNQLGLVAALARLRRAGGWRLTLVGPPRDAAYARRLRLRVASLGLRGRVRITGGLPASGVARHYRAADLFALPSLHEGWGIAFVEALAHRLPVVACRSGALPEALAGGAVRWVADGAADHALARALRPLLCHRAERRCARAAAGRAGVRVRTWAKAGRDFVTAIERIIAR